MTPKNTCAMGGLQHALDEQDKRLFFKGAILADDTLLHFGFEGYTEVVQRAGDVVTSHSYQCGAGTFKIAEAHSWFSDPWYQLRVPHTPMTPCCFDQSADWTPTTMYAPTEEQIKQDVAAFLAGVRRKAALKQAQDMEDVGTAAMEDVGTAAIAGQAS